MLLRNIGQLNATSLADFEADIENVTLATKPEPIAAGSAPYDRNLTLKNYDCVDAFLQKPISISELIDATEVQIGRIGLTTSH